MDYFLINQEIISKKPIEQCTGQEITQELLYHLGVPEGEIERISEESATTIPVLYAVYHFLLYVKRTRAIDH